MDKRMRSLPPLEEFLEIRQGVVTGADSIFIIDSKGGPARWGIPFRSSSSMTGRWRRTPFQRGTSQSVFFPYLEGSKVKEKELRRDFPKTWAIPDGAP